MKLRSVKMQVAARFVDTARDIKMVQIISLVFVLALTGCGASTNAESKAPQDGKVEGSLTINGETVPLKYIYTGKTRHSPGAPPSAEVLITNEPLTHETLSSIFHELNIGFSYEGMSKGLKGTSLKALYFKSYELLSIRDYPDWKGTPGYEGILMTADSSFEFGGGHTRLGDFEGVSFDGDTFKAKATNEWKDVKENDSGQTIKIAAKFSVSIEVKVRDESLVSRSFSSNSKVWKSALSALPEQGSSEGTLTMAGNTVQLKYAYAMKPRLEYLSKEIKVLMTNKPLPKEYLLFKSERRLTAPEGLYVLDLKVDESGTLSGSTIIGDEGSNNMFDRKAITGFKLENGRISGSVKNTQSQGINGRRDSYSVRFDVPLKNWNTGRK
jgi:hypothetical protein